MSTTTDAMADVATLKAAADILRREGRHDVAEQCATAAAALAVASVIGATINPNPGNRLHRLG